MSGKCRPSLRGKTLYKVERCNLSQTDKDCIKAVFDKFEGQQAELEQYKDYNEKWQEKCETLQAEIERLSKVRCHFPNDNYCKVVEVNEENEILKEENQRLIFDLKTAKAEAVKEFAERLKENITECRLVNDYVYQGYDTEEVLNCIDNLLKEMVGGEE